MENITRKQVSAGQDVYGKLTLAAYDALVLGATCRWLWQCKASQMLEQYNTLVSDNHLDVGVGSGYFLDHCRFPSDAPRLALMDLNEDSLNFTARRVSRYSPELYRRNVLEDMSVGGRKFDSVGMNFLLHCLPGSFGYTGRVFDHCREIMNDGAVLFGSTVLGAGNRPNLLARALMGFYNRKGIFSNKHDTETALREELSKRFSEVQLQVRGEVALFSARK
ncbi:MAG: methyltransferase type 12 [Alteromonadaceae bacterium]|nr:methyltransferase type 12 [Alteromonadaceae bacterium]|tara:strand:+ start:3645 stop:4307 length:663 start_codon:yes stop_codon:yes gene_type:complete